MANKEDVKIQAENQIDEEQMYDKGLSEAERKIFMASQWELMFRRLKKHRIAVVAICFILVFYIVASFCEFFAPYDPFKTGSKMVFVPPQAIHFFDNEGNFHLRPFVYGLESERDMETFRKYYTPDKSKKYPIYFLSRGEEYKLWNRFESNVHLFGTNAPEQKIYLLGTDSMGRDMLSRIIYGTRISLSIGLMGVLLSFVIGMFIGGISGYFGGILDTLIQRVIEIFQSIPKIPLWMALTASLPDHWPLIRVYFAITIILSFMGWVVLARVVRGKFLSLREEDFVMAAKTSGSSDLRIIWRHLIPSFTSHIIAALTLALPRMILAETALSFLGIGLREPLVSWGVLLRKAQNVQTLTNNPWLLIPGIIVIIAILCFNFAGDGLRDAADPY